MLSARHRSQSFAHARTHARTHARMHACTHAHVCMHPRARTHCPQVSIRGYDTSACDPLIIAYCAIFDVEVRHSFNGTRIRYELAGPRAARRIVHLASGLGHMQWLQNEDLH